MNFIFSEVWWMNTIIAAIITGMFTLICSYIAYSYKIRKGLDTIERMEHTQESRQKELSGQHEKMSEKLSQEHQQISRDIRPYADKIVRIDSHMTDLVQRANQQDSLYHSLSREQQKMSDFIMRNLLWQLPALSFASSHKTCRKLPHKITQWDLHVIKNYGVP